MNPEADKVLPRLVAAFSGLNIYDARETIRVRLKGEHAPAGINACLRSEGFRKRPDGEWEARNTPANIFAAQVIAHEFFPGGA